MAVQRNILLSSGDLILAKKRGIGQYSEALLKALKGIGSDISIITSSTSSENLRESLSENSGQGISSLKGLWIVLMKRIFGFRFITISNERNSEKSYLGFVSQFVNTPHYFRLEYLWNKLFRSPINISTEGFDLYWSAVPNHVKCDPKTKVVHTVHDLIPLYFQAESSYSKVFEKMLDGMMATSDLILTVSDYSRDQLLSRYPDTKTPIITTYEPVPWSELAEAVRLEKTDTQIVLDEFKLEKGKYLLYTGAIQQSKGVFELIEAYDIVRNEVQIPLVLAGGIYEEDEKIVALLDEVKSGKHPGVVYAGYVSEEQKWSLLKESRAFVFLSFFEGFGIPPLEAMKMGVPVLSSGRGSLTEVCGDAAEIVDPSDKAVVIESLKVIVGDEEKRALLVDKGKENVERFSFESFQTKIEKAIMSL